MKMIVTTTVKAGRGTRQQSAVAETLRHCQTAVTAEEVWRMTRQRGQHVGLTTVYRALERLHGSGHVARVSLESKEAAYLWCEGDHHHHLICSKCGSAEELTEELVAPLIDRVEAKHGFDIDHSRLDLYGTCPSCQGNEDSDNG